MPEQPSAQVSAVERIKAASRLLRGTIAESLADDLTGGLRADDQPLLKFHGSYQQEDRDARKNRRKDGLGKHYMFMVRCRIPGGRLTSAQYLAIDDIAGVHANGTVRFTATGAGPAAGTSPASVRPAAAGPWAANARATRQASQHSSAP